MYLLINSVVLHHANIHNNYVIEPPGNLELECTRAVPKCRIIVVKVSQTERYSFQILHA